MSEHLRVPDIAVDAYTEYRKYHDELLDMLFGHFTEEDVSSTDFGCILPSGTIHFGQNDLVKRVNELLRVSLQYTELKEALVGDSPNWTHEELVERALELVDEVSA